LSVAAATLVCSSCTDRRVAPLTVADTISSESPSVIALSADRSAIPTTGRVSVAATFGPDMQGAGVGAFTARLAYDSTKLEFLAGESTTAGIGAMRADNGVVTIAGASPSGFAKNDLFTAAFRVRDAAPGAGASIGNLRLTVTEISGVDFANRLPADSARRTTVAR
jgi:hypothetical protein